MKLVKKETRCGLTVGLSLKEEGSFHPKQENFRERFKDLQKATDTKDWYFPSLGFTNLLMWEADGLDHFPGFLRSLSADEKTGHKTDGVLLPRRKQFGMGICNADCPIIVGTAGPYKFLLHAGLNNLIRKEGCSIVETLLHQLKTLGVDPEEIQVWIGFGATHMTYGIGADDDRWPLIKKWQVHDYSVIFGPRKGQPGVDLHDIALHQFMEQGVPPENVELDHYDTALGLNHESPGEEHFSNLMKCDPFERNFAGAW